MVHATSQVRIQVLQKVGFSIAFSKPQVVHDLALVKWALFLMVRIVKMS